ncbi:hypothetical protein LCGC14_2496370 [marine sediment metagenome]|uniref:Glycosyltransferase 2-like domain-containing protein n=1 Tax=marine sediment metagenome TaxID=412755 RepID=A0A0F9B362_9ZZZZ
MIRIGITAAPRNGDDCLARTVASLERAGFDLQYRIFAEPDTDTASPRLLPHSVVRRIVRLGEYHNWISGMRALLDCPGDPTAILTVQDDVIFCRNVREFLRRRLWPSPECGAVQVYTGRRYRGQRDFPRGLTKLPRRFMRELNSACAIAFRPGVAAEILDYARRHPWTGRRFAADVPADVQELDCFIGTALLELGHEIWCCNPSLGFHIGEQSALGHGGSTGHRQALDFPGAGADALEVIA